MDKKIGAFDCYWCIILFKSLCKEMSLGGGGGDQRFGGGGISHPLYETLAGILSLMKIITVSSNIYTLSCSSLHTVIIKM